MKLGFYLKEGQYGQYWSAKLPNGTWVNFQKNGSKKSEKHPDHFMTCKDDDAFIAGIKELIVKDAEWKERKAVDKSQEPARKPMGKVDDIPF